MDRESVTEYRVRVIVEERTSTYETSWDGTRKKTRSSRFKKVVDSRSSVMDDLGEAFMMADNASTFVTKYVSPDRAAKALVAFRSKFFGFMTPADPDRLIAVARSIRRTNRRPEVPVGIEPGRYHLTLGVRGASNLKKKTFEDLDSAVARLEKWAASNSTGDYYGNVRDAETGLIVETRNS